MSDLPVRWTFVDFHQALPSKRSSSAPPGFMSAAVAGNLRPRKRRSRAKKLHQPKNDDIALQEFHTRATMERWAHLARSLCSKFARDAKAESNLALRMRGSLPRYLFGDWAYYTFVAKGHADILSQLCKSGFIHENKESNRFEFGVATHVISTRKTRSCVIWYSKLTNCWMPGIEGVFPF